MKRKISLKKIVRFIIIVFLVLLFILFMIKIITKKNDKEKVVSIIDNIEKYGYSLDDNETDYYKSVFNDLKDLLNKEYFDEQEYAGLISKLFIADFYNLDNKASKNDVGGVQYVYEKFQKDFRSLAVEGPYHYINVADKKQELPIVEEVEITNIENKAFSYNDKKDDKAFVISLKIKYKKDLGYPNEAVLTIIHSNNKLEIAKLD